MKKYGMRLRPAGLGCQPNGFVKIEHCDKCKDGYWDYIYYDRELTEDELKHYSMDFIEEVKEN